MKFRLIAAVLLIALVVGLTGGTHTAAASERPTITLKSPSVTFGDEIRINLYVTVTDMGSIPANRMGLLIFNTNKPDATYANADKVSPGGVWVSSLGMYCLRTPGIPAKQMGDEIYFRAYIRLDDGSYVYSRMAHYSPKKYAYNMIRSDRSMDIRALAVAMLQYGAAAQKHFGYRTDALVDADLTPAERSLTLGYHADMVPTLTRPNHGKQGRFADDGGFTRSGVSVTMDGAFALNFYMEPAFVPDGEVRIYFWSQSAYDNAAALFPENASGSCKMTLKNGIYQAKLSGIAAKDMGDAVYAAALYESGGELRRGGVITYSVSSYCRSKAGGNGTMAELAAAMAVYGHYAQARGEYDELQSYADAISQVQTDTTLTLSLMADMHYCQNIVAARQIRSAVRKMTMLSRYTRVDALVNLGDMVQGNEEKSHTMQDMEEITALMTDNADCPVLAARGNHDDNSWYSYKPDGYPGRYMPDEMISGEEWHSEVFSRKIDGVVTDPANPAGGYGYYDHEASRIRVFILNTVDIPDVRNDDGSYRYDAYRCYYAFSNEQLAFVADALQFADKENPGDWAALFLTHIPLDTTNDSGYRFGGLDALVRGHVQMLGIIDAYRKGSSYSFEGTVKNNAANPNYSTELPEHFYLDVEADYSAKGQGEVIAFINGHTHTDNVSQAAGYDYSLSRGYTYIGVWGTTGFATCVIDREKGTVSTFKYGDSRTQSQSEKHNPGAIDGEKELGVDVAGGVWQVSYARPATHGQNIYNGLSDKWADGYNHTATTLDTNTLELTTASAHSKYALSKGVMVKQGTRYLLPADFVGTVYSYAVNGKFKGTFVPEDTPGGKVITIGSAGGYVVFSFHKLLYPDYPDFTLKEL